VPTGSHPETSVGKFPDGVLFVKIIAPKYSHITFVRRFNDLIVLEMLYLSELYNSLVGLETFMKSATHIKEHCSPTFLRCESDRPIDSDSAWDIPMILKVLVSVTSSWGKYLHNNVTVF